MDNYYSILDKTINLIIPGNRFTQSKIIEDSIKDVLKNKFGDGWKDKGSYFFSIYDTLRKKFNLESYVGDASYVYLMYYMPLNIPKVQLALLQLMRKVKLPRELSILDIGSAVGTSTVAIMDLVVLLDNLCNLYGEESYFDKVEISSIEGSAANIAVFKENYNCLKDRLSKFAAIDKIIVNEPQEMDITNGEILGNYDIIILSNVISEVNPYAKRKEILTNLNLILKESGSIIIIEPATKERVKSMNNLKYDICKATGLKCIAPCSTCSECYKCWIYQKCDVANSELISYVDELYEANYESKYTDSFYNNRLKWVYCILNRGAQEEVCSDLSTLPNEKFTSVKVHIVGGRRINSYEFCDGNGNEGILIGKGIGLSYFNFGDLAELDNVIIKKAKKYIIEYSQESNEKNFFNARSAPIVFHQVDKSSLAYLLKRLWGFDDFREGQLDLIEGALKGDDILGILPTAAGKSVCYQLPAILGNGASLVVSPLKSLIKDQIANLKRIGFEFVDYIDSSKSADEKKKTLSRFKAGSLKLLYLTPERLQMKDFQDDLKSVLENLRINYFIIDEAHCASEWGHDFRPSYLKLVDVAKKIDFSNIIAVTATASPKVKADILDIFKIKEENVITSRSLDRDEISLQVINIPIEESKDDYLKEALFKDTVRTLQKNDISDLHNGGSGIIFCIYAKPEGKSTIPFGTEYILDEVKKNGVDNADLYHSKLDDDKREDTQERFTQDKFPLLVATKGFGMGIDKPNIRYIVHMCFANSLEAYYQEAGRAGRDRQHAHSIIISRARTKECIQQKHGGNIDKYEPKCINRWKCFYKNEFRCDYGMQARFINDSYPNANKMLEDLKGFYKNLTQCSNGQDEFFITKYINAKEYEKYLFYFQKHGIINNYYISEFMGEEGCKFGIVIDQEKFNSPKISIIINDIVKELQEYKKQKYNMLESIWEYVDNKTRCRRQFLLDYFQDTVTFGEEGCKFCDIEGISSEKAIQTSRSLIIERIYNDFQKHMESNNFDYPQIKNLLDKIYQEKEQEGIKVRAMRYLEDYTDNLVALYFRIFISLKQDKDDAYVRNQAKDLITLLLKSGQTKNCIEVIEALIEIDEVLATQIIVSSSALLADPYNADALFRGLNSKLFKDLVYKIHLDSRISSLVNALERSV